MDDLWSKAGLDLRLTHYNVNVTGCRGGSSRGCGFIEVVLKACTTAYIHYKCGGGATGAFDVKSLATYLRTHNPTDTLYKKAVDNFFHSCAAYVVATYVLGVGDRHNDNIMITLDGHLFHIDFGHILGNFKVKFGINRERSKMVFTPEMAYVFGGDNYNKSPQLKVRDSLFSYCVYLHATGLLLLSPFLHLHQIPPLLNPLFPSFASLLLFQAFKELCVKAYDCLRNNAAELEMLCTTMIAAGMPELSDVSHVNYLRQRLCLDKSSEEAGKVFLSDLQEALETTSRRFDNLIHLLKHN